MDSQDVAFGVTGACIVVIANLAIRAALNFTGAGVSIMGP